MTNIGLGLHHSGIEIQGVEYSYGGNINNSGTGVFQMPPCNVDNATYYCSYNMGVCTDLSKVYSTLEQVRQQFRANEYSLINQNCNHFSDAFCQALLGKRIPAYVNRLARMGSWT